MTTTRRPRAEVTSSHFRGAGQPVPVVEFNPTRTSGPIEVVHHPAERFYELLDAGTSVALLVYEKDRDRMAITHAMVREDRRGNGWGSTLIATAINDLTTSGAKVTNYCASVATFLDKHPEYSRMVEVGARANA